MIQRLRHLISAPATLAALQALATGAPSAAPVSLCLDLGAGDADWLDLLPHHLPHWYRARPARREYRLGIGHALHLVSGGANRFAALDNAFGGLCREWRRNGAALAFAGFAFDPANDTPFPNALLAIPALLLESIGGQCTLTLTAPAGRIAQSVAEWPSLLIGSPRPADTGQWLPTHPETLAERAWMARVNAALRDIAASRIDKVVLARSRTVEHTASLSTSRILAGLIAQQPDATLYAHGNGRQTFLGATPERLVRRQGTTVSVDALAGTAWPGSLALAEGKNRHEQSLVVAAICAALAPLCASPPRVGPAEEHAAGRLVHWRSRIEATMRAGTGLFELVRALHPTPAVGGFPGEAAQAWLTNHGEKRAAWYSGGFGVLTPEGDGEFSVALRSALIDGNTAELHSGAGIVSGSDPLHELAETRAKQDTLLAALKWATEPDQADIRTA